VTSSNCSSSDNHQRWALYEDDSGYYLHNIAEGDLMVTDGAVAGYKIWGGTTSQYWHWDLCEPSNPGTTCG
jgi:hypothetical protein